MLTTERLDLAVKWRFFKHLLEGGDADSERTYRWHIEKRTNGREPRSWKKSIDDYVSVCKSMLESMLKDGFNPVYPLEYGHNGRLRDGAHRLACSLLLNLDVYLFTVPRDGTATWGEKWFVRHGMKSDDLQRIKTDWTYLKHG